MKSLPQTQHNASEQVLNSISKPVNDIIQVWAVHEGDTDLSNGTPEQFFTKQSDAKVAAHTNGYWGGDSPITKQYLIKSNGKYYHLQDIKPIDLDGTIAKNQDKIKKEALKKLTKEEKIALGLEIEIPQTIKAQTE